MRRYLVLFARGPALEARRKGFRSAEAARLFRLFARGWRDAARAAGARLVLATPAEDRGAWRGCFPGGEDPFWLLQRGSSLGERLEDTARRAAALGGRAIIVGGDVIPSRAAIETGFEALEADADTVIGPSPDGGISLIGLGFEDLDLLRGIRERRRTLAGELLAALEERGRRVALLEPAADVDGRTALRSLRRREGNSTGLALTVRRALETDPAGLPPPEPSERPAPLHAPLTLRGPPAAA